MMLHFPFVVAYTFENILGEHVMKKSEVIKNKRNC